MRFCNARLCGATAVALTAIAGGAHAATVTADTNLCNTGPLAGCTVSATNLAETEAIAKIEFPSRTLTANDSFGEDDIDLGSLLSIDSNFSFALSEEGDDVREGTVTYTLTDGLPGMTAYSVKRGSETTLFYGDAINYDSESMSFTFDLGEYEEGEGDGVSSLVIYDNFNGGGGLTPIPLPAAGWLLIAGLGGLTVLGRRKR